MSLKLTWLSHSTWLLEQGAYRLLIDPFFTDNPAATIASEDVQQISDILITHGHFDHVADAATIAQRCQATIVANFEIAQWFQTQHEIDRLEMMNLGGSIDLPIGRLTMVPALHSSTLPDGTAAGTAAGYLLHASAGTKIYFAGDTALFSDMKLYAHGVDVAVLPIGDRFTMGPGDSIKAIQMIEPKRVLPAHYDTWPPITQDAQAWAERVRDQTTAQPIILGVGETVEI